MATRGLVCIKDGDTYKCVYNHYDSHPSCLGDVLTRHYCSTDRVNRLIEKGVNGFISIGTTVDSGLTETFPAKDPTPMNMFDNIDDVYNWANDMLCEWVYIWDPDIGCWTTNQV